MTRKLRAGLMAALLLLALATYVYYRRTLAARPLDPYALVPADAVLVLATRDHPALVRHLQEAGLWDKLSATRPAQQLSGSQRPASCKWRTRAGWSRVASTSTASAGTRA